MKSTIQLNRLIYPMILLNWFSVAQATEIYSYVDAQGVRHYTDTQPSNRPTIKLSPQKNTQGANSKRIYRFIDSEGVVHLTDRPKDKRYQLVYQGGTNLSTFSSEVYTGINMPRLHKRYDDYKELVNEIASETHMEPALLHAVIQTESAYNPKAISPKGAVGLMQLMPATAKRFGVYDRTDAAENVYGGALYLRYLLRLFDNDLRLALAGYNAGENAVIRYGHKVPPYRETKNYVKKVISLYQAHRDRQ